MPPYNVYVRVNDGQDILNLVEYLVYVFVTKANLQNSKDVTCVMGTLGREYMFKMTNVVTFVEVTILYIGK